MRQMKTALKPTSILLVVIFVLAPAYCPTASAAMIGTDVLLTPNHEPDRREFLQNLISREDIRQALVALGISPGEARARINSLSDDELENIFKNMADLPAGGDATGFVIIVGAVIIVLIIIVEYFSKVKMFPQLHQKD